MVKIIFAMAVISSSLFAGWQYQCDEDNNCKWIYVYTDID